MAKETYLSKRIRAEGDDLNYRVIGPRKPRVKTLRGYFRRHRKQELLKKLLPLKISRGSHVSPKYGTCIMEAFALVTGQKHTDNPICASDVLTSFLVEVNDVWPKGGKGNEKRAGLKELAPEVMGTAPTRFEQIKTKAESEALQLPIGYWVELRDDGNKPYRKLERRRELALEDALNETLGEFRSWHDNDKLTPEQVVKIVRKVLRAK